MISIADVEKMALDLPESDRATLAAHLLASFPSILQDRDGGIAEALARDAELDARAREACLWRGSTGWSAPRAKR
ncbi:MAG: addiction module protein [Vicinamibacteria bacterium]